MKARKKRASFNQSINQSFFSIIFFIFIAKVFANKQKVPVKLETGSWLPHITVH